MDVQPSDVVRDLGVLLDSELTLKHHVNRIAVTCFYHLSRPRQLKCHVVVEVMKQLISSFIFSRLDYCNALLIGLPLSTTLTKLLCNGCRTPPHVYFWDCRGVTTYAQP